MVKLGRIAAELERIYKIKNGTNRYTIQIKKDASANGESLKTQKDIAEMLGVSVDTIIRAKKIATMPPEWQERDEPTGINSTPPNAL